MPWSCHRIYTKPAVNRDKRPVTCACQFRGLRRQGRSWRPDVSTATACAQALVRHLVLRSRQHPRPPPPPFNTSIPAIGKARDYITASLSAWWRVCGVCGVSSAREQGSGRRRPHLQPADLSHLTRSGVHPGMKPIFVQDRNPPWVSGQP